MQIRSLWNRWTTFMWHEIVRKDKNPIQTYWHTHPYTRPTPSMPIPKSWIPSTRPLPTQPIPPPSAPTVPSSLLPHHLPTYRFLLLHSLSLSLCAIRSLSLLPLPPNPHLQRRRPLNPLFHRLSAIKPHQGTLIRRLHVHFLLCPCPQRCQILLLGCMAAILGGSVGREQGCVVGVCRGGVEALLVEVVLGWSEGVGRGASRGGVRGWENRDGL